MSDDFGLPDVTQKQYEQFFEELKTAGVDATQMDDAHYSGAVVRCAVKVGWLSIDVDSSSPKDINRIKRKIIDYVSEVLEPDPNS